MAFRDFDYDREYGLVPDLVKQFVVYLYRHIRSAAVCAGGGKGACAVLQLGCSAPASVMNCACMALCGCGGPDLGLAAVAVSQQQAPDVWERQPLGPTRQLATTSSSYPSINITSSHCSSSSRLHPTHPAHFSHPPSVTLLLCRQHLSHTPTTPGSATSLR